MSYLVNRPAQNDVSDLQTLSGVPDGSTNLGTFTGNTVRDNPTVKEAIQDLETEVEDRLPDFVQWQRKDGGYYFDGTNDYVSAPVNIAGSDKFTFIITGVASALNNTLIADYGSAGNRSFRIAINASGQVEAYWFDGNSTNFTREQSAVLLSAGQAFCIGVVRNAVNDTDIYFNGELVTSSNDVTGTGGSATFASANSNLYFGARQDSAGWLRGEIREVRLFNRALSASDVAKYSRGEATDFSDRVTVGTDLQTGSWFNSTSASLQFSNFSGSATGFTADYNNANSSNRAIIALTKTLVPGKRYRANFTLDTDGASVRVYTMSTDAGGGAMDIQAVSAASATAISVEFVQSATTGAFWGFLVNSVPASGSIAVSNFTLKEIGEVASYLPESSTPTLWADVSPLGRHATNNGATHIFNRRLYADGFVQFSNLQTSAAGLAAGQVWRDGNDLKIV